MYLARIHRFLPMLAAPLDYVQVYLDCHGILVINV